MVTRAAHTMRLHGNKHGFQKSMRRSSRKMSGYGQILLTQSVNPIGLIRKIQFVFIFYQIQTWVIAPYRAPERMHKLNTEFNFHVARLRIRSEHAIGFLKGRFPSLRGLRLQINNADMHQIATYWILVCIAVHMFAFMVEREEWGADDETHLDPFIDEGMTTSSPSPSASEGPGSDEDLESDYTDGNGALSAAKDFRSMLKCRLLWAKQRKRVRSLEM